MTPRTRSIIDDVVAILRDGGLLNRLSPDTRVALLDDCANRLALAAMESEVCDVCGRVVPTTSLKPGSGTVPREVHTLETAGSTPVPAPTCACTECAQAHLISDLRGSLASTDAKVARLAERMRTASAACPPGVEAGKLLAGYADQLDGAVL